jgi:hypothetical protein
MIQKFVPFFCLLSFFLAGLTCQRQPDPDAALFDKTWLHAYEEDQEDVKTYRPNTYNFPPSRGRTGFALEKNGTFRLYAIAPTDGLEEHIGHWEMLNDKELRITFKDQESEDFNLELIAVTEEMIKARRLPASK